MNMIRGLVAFVFCVLIFATPVLANPVVVFDAKTGKVMVAKDAGRPWHPASLTKIMTAYVVLEAISKGEISLKTKGKVTKTSSAPPPSKIGFKRGKRVSVDFALKALMVYSANDMAALLAETVSGSQAKFVQRMNDTARRLGMTGTRFMNPHGLHHEDQVTTARDMAILSYVLLNRYPSARKISSAPFLKLGKKKLRNRNYLLRIWKQADGLKTGFICPSGFNLVATAKVGGRSLVGVVFGTRSGKARARKAKVVIENAASLQPTTSITALQNQVGTPSNMRKRVCGGKGLRMVSTDDFSGWGVTFGKFKSAAEAEAVINGIQAVRPGVTANAGTGVVRIPFTKDFVPVSFKMNQSNSQNLCQRVRSSGGKCEVVTPSVFASFASLADRERAGSGKPLKQKASSIKKVQKKDRSVGNDTK